VEKTLVEAQQSSSSTQQPTQLIHKLFVSLVELHKRRELLTDKYFE